MEIPASPIIIFWVVNREIVNYPLFNLLSKRFGLSDIEIKYNNELEKGNIRLLFLAIYIFLINRPGLTRLANRININTTIFFIIIKYILLYAYF